MFFEYIKLTEHRNCSFEKKYKTKIKLTLKKSNIFLLIFENRDFLSEKNLAIKRYSLLLLQQAFGSGRTIIILSLFSYYLNKKNHGDIEDKLHFLKTFL